MINLIMSLGIDFYGTGEVTLLQRELKSISKKLITFVHFVQCCICDNKGDSKLA